MFHRTHRNPSDSDPAYLASPVGYELRIDPQLRTARQIASFEETELTARPGADASSEGSAASA